MVTYSSGSGGGSGGGGSGGYSGSGGDSLTSQGNAPNYVQSSLQSTTRTRTVDMLPQIFQTSTNKKFLNATLDQITQKSALEKIQGFIGRRQGIGVGLTENDNYLAEPDTVRSNYQLEPSVIYNGADNTDQINSVITYPGILDALKLNEGTTVRHDRLFEVLTYFLELILRLFL